ncbi:MAG: ATP-dependent DNA ligase [Chitinophagaceae bacterium]
MKQFAALVKVLGSHTKTNDKLQALSDYFSVANDKDKVWVMAIFSGRRPRRSVNSKLLSQWCMEIASLPGWLFTECYGTVGDLAETIALLLPEKTTSAQAEEALHYYIEQLMMLEKASEKEKKKFINASWMNMDRDERFVFNKLITGSFRIGVSQKTMVNALSKTVNLEANTIAHRISGNWDPAATIFHDLLSADTIDHSRPYPFYLAYALENNIDEMGNVDEWQAEWKWDGIRGQIIQRNDEQFVWSRGEELMTDKFPEFHVLKNHLPNGIVLDGEIMPFANNKALPFAILQTRIGRKNITKKNLQDAPVAFIAYDIIEQEGKDIRGMAMEERRKLLEKIVGAINLPVLQLSPIINFTNWDELKNQRTNARDINSEGIMLKRKNSAYGTGRKRGDWWKWKIDPLVIDAVMIYAQKGSGRRSNLYTDYTFAVKDGDKLVSFAKAYSGLTDKEFAQVDNFVKRNSLEKFGPVRTVKPELVFEIAFEGIAASNRHKSGVALRFPRMSRWRRDKKPEEINTLDDLKKMLEMYGK